MNVVFIRNKKTFKKGWIDREASSEMIATSSKHSFLWTFRFFHLGLLEATENSWRFGPTKSPQQQDKMFQLLDYFNNKHVSRGGGDVSKESKFG